MGLKQNVGARGGPPGADIAILVLSKSSRVRPELIYTDGDEVGKEITIVGWGDSVKMGGDPPEDGEGSGKFRRGKNIVTSTQENTLTYRLDEFGLPLEAMA